MIKVGVTGGIGSGKTTVCKLFEKEGVPVYYADDRAKHILTNNIECKTQVVELFGAESYLENGSLNRIFLAKQVFSDDEKVAKLNAIVHPLVEIDFNEWVAKNTNAEIVIKEAALLFETGDYKNLDKIIVVDASEGVRIQRVLKRDPQRTEEQIRNIIAKQLPQEEKNKMANFLIDNSKNLATNQVLNILAKLKEK